ncbi:MAG: site-specific integrase, partial [Trebonia sp.]
MELTFFSGAGWESWDVEARPVIPEQMPVLVDDDLLFDGGSGLRPSVAVNRWLRELPVSGAPAPGTWAVYARILRDWMAFCGERGTGVFAGREGLRGVLSAYAVYRADGPERARLEATTWNQHVSVLSSFYQWAVAEGHADAVPFSYAQAQVRYGDVRRDVQVNLARRRIPKRHVTIRYLEADFADLFIAALGGLGPDGLPDGGYRGRELARNSAVGKLALSSGLRRQEFTYLLAYEIPPLPSSSSGKLPVPFPVPAGVTKGRKYRTTWTDHASLEAVHQYAGLDRAAAAGGSLWRPPRQWGEPLMVSEPDARGGRVNGRRVRWDQLGPGQRRRLVAPDGG